MKKIIPLLCAVLLSLSLTSCYSSKVYSGSLKHNDPVVKVNKNNNSIFLFGLVPTDKASQQEAKDFVGNNNNYMVRTYHTFVDGLLSVITCGIYTPTTTEYYLPMSDVKNEKSE